MPVHEKLENGSVVVHCVGTKKKGHKVPDSALRNHAEYVHKRKEAADRLRLKYIQRHLEQMESCGTPFPVV